MEPKCSSRLVGEERGVSQGVTNRLRSSYGLNATAVRAVDCRGYYLCSSCPCFLLPLIFLTANSGMSGGASLGPRTSGSYGSLQQLPASPPLAPRKPAKVSLGGATARGLFCARICNLAGRRQRLLLLFLVSVAVAVCFFFSSLVNSKGGWGLP
jgi:hypothetical protein